MPTELLPPAVRDQFLYGNLSPKKVSFPEKRFWRPNSKNDSPGTLDTSEGYVPTIREKKKDKKVSKKIFDVIFQRLHYFLSVKSVNF